MKKHHLYIILGLAAFGIAARLLPHEFNFSPLGAIALFCGFMLQPRWAALAAPVAIALAGDVLLYALYGTRFAPEMAFVYPSYALAAGIGGWLRQRWNALTTLGGALASSTTFFIITNLGCWLMGFILPATYNLYAHDLGGLWDCYVMALPFYRATFLSDMVFTTILFGSYYLLTRRLPAHSYEKNLG